MKATSKSTKPKAQPRTNQAANGDNLAQEAYEITALLLGGKSLAQSNWEESLGTDSEAESLATLQLIRQAIARLESLAEAIGDVRRAGSATDAAREEAIHG